MKIEIGESIILSWLKHEMKCQIVQMNWKPSTTIWKLHNENEINNIINYFQDEFKKKHKIDLFKKSSSVTQIIKQGEIDALGLVLHGNKTKKVFAVDVAFHENGLNYKSPKDTIASVLKKMTRSAMAILGYLNIKEGKLVFASPKIGQHIYIELLKHSEVIEKELNKKWNYNFKFQIIANYDFYKTILNPVSKLSKEIADTTELFVRSIQLYNLFNKNTEKYNIEKIEYKTTPCYGTCPIFKIKINKDREAEFIAESFNFTKEYTNEIEGKFKTRITEEVYSELINLLNYMNFPILKNKYSINATDLVGCSLKITYNDGKEKNISDYGQKGTIELMQLYSLISNLRFNQNWEKLI